MSRIELPDITKYIEDSQPIIFDDEHFMRAALRCAENAAAAGEVPVGAVAVKDGIIIAKAWNQVELLKDATAHAEVLLISSISAALNDWRMEDVDIYVTKEPCAMCAGAMVNARVRRASPLGQLRENWWQNQTFSNSVPFIRITRVRV